MLDARVTAAIAALSADHPSRQITRPARSPVLPETSCEEGNRLLDRAMVVGTPDMPEIGLFGAFASDLLTGAMS